MANGPTVNSHEHLNTPTHTHTHTDRQTMPLVHCGKLDNYYYTACVDVYAHNFVLKTVFDFFAHVINILIMQEEAIPLYQLIYSQSISFLLS